jgi:hypothetical protein
LKVQIQSLEREIESFKKQGELDKKAKEDLRREREILNKKLVLSSNSQQKQADLVKIAESTKKNLDQEIQGFKIQAQKQRKVTPYCFRQPTEIQDFNVVLIVDLRT